MHFKVNNQPKIISENLKQEPPLFIERFQEQKVKEKDTVCLKAKVVGNPTPEITWLRNNEAIKPSDKVKMTFDGTNVELTVTNVDSEEDSGNYKVFATNPVGKASHGATVTVKVDTVRFTKKLKKTYEVAERQTLTMECETSHTVTTQWWHEEKEISGMDHRVVVQEGKKHKLIIKKATLNDVGKYRCTVVDQKTETTVNVIETKPEFVRKLQDLEVTEKEVAILEVEVSSDTAEVIWQKEGKIIEESRDKYKIEKEGGIRKLLIRSTSIHDEGEYSCRLLDEECAAEVTVIELPPEIIGKLQDQNVNKGEKAQFEIELTKGDALVRWFKNGVELQFSDHVQLSIDGKRQKLKIYNSEPEDAGIYSCEVWAKTIHLIVLYEKYVLI